MSRAICSGSRPWVPGSGCIAGAFQSHWFTVNKYPSPVTARRLGLSVLSQLDRYISQLGRRDSSVFWPPVICLVLGNSTLGRL